MFDHHRPHPHVHVLRFRGHRAIRRAVTGTALILFGSGWLLHGQGVITREQLWLILPAVLAVGGLVRLAFARDAAAVVRGVLAVALAAYFTLVIEHVGGMTFATTWPVLLIAAGLGSVARAVVGRRDDGCEEPNW
jgi:hypothetical protein